jgi:hypothetical protein
MNPFETHGLRHISVSQLNLFAAAPGVYVMERLLKRTAPVGSAAHRGSAVEDGVALGLTTDASLDECIAKANAAFTSKTALSTDPRRQKERDSLAGMVEQGIALLRPWGKPDRVQQRIEWRIEGIEVPVLGFSDFEYDNHGLVVDLKTSHALPSQVKIPHARQVASYLGGDSNRTAGVAYVTSKKAHMLQVDNPRQHVCSLERMAHSLRSFLAMSKDPHELAACLTVDVESFYLAHPTARQNAFDVYGV